MHLLSWLDSTLVKKQPPWCSMKKDVLRNFAKLTGKHLCQSLFFNKVAATLLKKRLLHRCFPANFAKFRRTRFLQNTSGRLFYQLNYHMVKNSSLPSRIHFFFFHFFRSVQLPLGFYEDNYFSYNHFKIPQSFNIKQNFI